MLTLGYSTFTPFYLSQSNSKTNSSIKPKNIITYLILYSLLVLILYYLHDLKIKIDEICMYLHQPVYTHISINETFQ